MSQDVKCIHYLISISWRRPLNPPPPPPAVITGSAQVPLARACKCTITPAFHFNADVPGRRRFAVGWKLNVTSVIIEAPVYCLFFFQTGNCSHIINCVYRLEHEWTMNVLLHKCVFVSVCIFIYKDTCITAQFVPVCLSVFGLLCTGGLNQLPGARALNCRGQQNVSSYWLYEWWSYLPVEWMAALTNDHLIFHFLDALILQGWLAWIKRYRGGGGGGGGGGGEQSEKLVIIENIHKSSAGMFRVSAKCLSQQIDVFSGGGYKSKKSPRLFPRPEVICFIYHEQSHEYFLFSCLFLGLNFLNWTKHRLDGCAGSVAAVGFVSRQMLHEEKKRSD